MNQNEASQREFASIIGKTEGLVSHYKRDGRLVMSGKKVLVKESIDRIKQTAHLNGWANEQHAAKERGEINRKIENEKTFEKLRSDISTTQLDLETDNAKELFENARALREKSSALQAAAEHEKFIGELVSKDVVSKILFERARACRDSLMASARRTAPLIVGMDDISEIEKLLSDEYRHLLDQFSKLPLINE